MCPAISWPTLWSRWSSTCPGSDHPMSEREHDSDPEIQGETICPYCGVGCRLDLTGSLRTGLKIRGVGDAPANWGRLCAKGALLGETLVSPDRLTRPLWRRNRQDPFEPADWDGTIEHIVGRL